MGGEVSCDVLVIVVLWMGKQGREAGGGVEM